GQATVGPERLRSECTYCVHSPAGMALYDLENQFPTSARQLLFRLSLEYLRGLRARRRALLAPARIAFLTEKRHTPSSVYSLAGQSVALLYQKTHLFSEPPQPTSRRLIHT